METGLLMPAVFGAVIASLGVAVQLYLAPRKIAKAGHFALGMILAIYIGARLASGTLLEALAESAFAAIVLLASLAMLRWWPRGVGIVLILHGVYDQIFAHDAGLPDWYPPFCLGVDVVLGAAVIAFASPRQSV